MFGQATEKLKNWVRENFDAKEDYVCCERCGARILKEKIIHGKSEIKEKTLGIMSGFYVKLMDEKYVYTPKHCLNCWEKINAEKRRGKKH